MKKKILAMLLAATMTMTLVACGGGGSKTLDGLTVCLASEPDSIDPALNSAVDGGTMLAHLFTGITQWSQNEDGTLSITPAAVEELPDAVKNGDGTVTYTYKLREGMTWSDGEPLTAGDFVFAWNRAASPALAADYNYLFEIVDGYAAMWEERETGEVDEDGNPVVELVNPDAKLNISAPDDLTFVVTLTTDAAYWNELMAFPAFYPVREDVVGDESWATDPSTYVCNGPYKMAGWDHNSVITLEKNPDYIDADSITMEKIYFYLSDDTNNMLTNFKNDAWLLIDDVPSNEMAALAKDYPDEYFVAGQMGTYYVCWNINENLLPEDSTLTGAEAAQAEDEIRVAINQLFDRTYIVEEIGQAGQVPASSFVSAGLTDADGSQFYLNTGVSDDFVGYFDVENDHYADVFAAAVDTLKQYYNYDEATGMFTNVPTLTYLYNTSDSHKAIGENLQATLATVGINVNLVNQEWNTFLNTRKNGDYTVARNGWLADYNDPMSYLDMWTTNSGNNDVQFGKGDHANLAMYDLDLTPYGYDIKVENGTWAETYDVLISKAKTCSDSEARYAMMHMAEDMLMESGCICPLYFYTDIYMLDDSVEGFYSSPLGYKFFMYTTSDKIVFDAE